jgi:rSAM/selenodomain-associated transferase 2/rSAM/selenodomain-associated transferase 1
MSTQHLLVFTRWPEPGRTKTRLIPALGPEGAADLQEWLTGHALLQARLWAAAPDRELRLLTTGASPRRFTKWLGPDVQVVPQAEGDLGDRLSAAARQSFQAGAEQVVMMGIDCPGVTTALLTQAFEALQDRDAVIGPATDGGYTLLGCKTFSETLFRNIPWGSGEVLETTRERLQNLQWSVESLPALPDIDEPEDVRELETFRTAERTPGVSVILIAKNEEALIREAITSVLNQADEVIVVDGGSDDETVDRARHAGARVIHSPPGRARQMNSGADRAAFDTLLFLHADSRLSPGAVEQSRAALQRPGTVLTALNLRIQGSRSAYRWIEAGVRFRSGLLQRPYGDQALALRRETFVRLGGFADLPLLEDLDLVRRAARRGQLDLLSGSSSVSDRRWKRRGILRTTLLNQAILLGHAFGISPDRLRRWYGS